MLACLAGILSTFGPALAAKKAFIVAIANYKTLIDLETPIADGEAMKSRLEALGFQVVLAKDTTRDQFRAKWADFKNQVTRDDDVVFYFAGHGVQIDSLNYLLPLSTPGLAAGREAIVAASINFHEIVEELQVRAKRSIFILDACREDPFDAGSKARNVLGQGKGLAAIEPIYDTFVMYSAGANQQAADKLKPDSRHSAYIERLLPILGKPELTLVDVAKTVQTEVFTATAAVLREQAQKPAYFDGILGNYYLARADNGAVVSDSESIVSDNVIRLGGFASWDSECQGRPAPRISVLTPPRHGYIVLRFEKFSIAGKHFGVGCEKRPGRGIAAYYVVTEPDRASSKVDTVKLSVHHWSVAPATTVDETFEIDLATRYSKRVTGR
ncbi:MAG: caspase family protein [Hyphomicrobiaceae bacterium]|nr:caspase family protein [Hyphomicrobiaceae bacterium]